MGRLKHRDSGSKTALPKPIVAAKRRRQLYPFFFSMGPVALSICSVLLIGLMAVLYLTQVGQAETANQQIQNYHDQQAVLQRQNQDLAATIAQEQSPTYIAGKAQAMGLVPENSNAVKVIVVKHLEQMLNTAQNDQNNQNIEP
ncbi:MAG: septum formation initiator family protein [Ktedonobacteraceae bacterium]